MNIRNLAFTVVAIIGASTAFAELGKPAAVEARPACREQPARNEIAAAMREVLRAAVPDIRLPAIELELPALDAAAALLR